MVQLQQQNDVQGAKQIEVMRAKNLYLKEDPAMVTMYERRIGIRDLQSWLR